MSNFDFATIDSTRPASLKQVFAVSNKFLQPAAKTLGVSGVKINKILRPRITAVIQSMEPNHGMIQKWFKSTTCPKAVLELIKTEGLSEDKPKASKKVKATPKPKASKKSKTSPKPKALKMVAEPSGTVITPETAKAAKESQSASGNKSWKTTSKSDEFSQRLTILEAMQSQTSEDVQSIKSAMESLVASLGGLNS
tara:strand:- start:188 stop:775 length:588 start_codon:yes stop_codon:yes gene_type:complete